jgi:nucleoid-associated protein YgaU
VFCLIYEHVFAKIAFLAVSALIVWTVIARPSGAHGEKIQYRVKPYDTLWTIASSHYGGDARAGVWRIQRANNLDGVTIRPGEVLVLP